MLGKLVKSLFQSKARINVSHTLAFCILLDFSTLIVTLELKYKVTHSNLYLPI